MGKTDVTIGAIIFSVIVLLIFAPFIDFWICYFSGWLAKITIGNILCKSLALIGINILPEQIPLLAGGLGWIGGFFKSFTRTLNSKKD